MDDEDKLEDQEKECINTFAIKATDQLGHTGIIVFEKGNFYQ